MTLEERVAALEARIGAPDPNNDEAVVLRMSKVQVAMDGVVSKLDNIALYLKEKGVHDVIVQEVLALVPRSSGASVDVLAVLRDAPVVRMDGKVCLGMDPVDAHARLQLEGAEILGKSNINATDPQNPNEPHTNVFSLAGNDGGMRWIQYGYWGPNGKKRNTQNRPLSILALDSMGDLCKSTQPVGSDYDGGQSWYIRTSGQFVDFCVYKVGHAIRILKSAAGYGSTDVQQL
jgi:hypothetical protein